MVVEEFVRHIEMTLEVVVVNAGTQLLGHRDVVVDDLKVALSQECKEVAIHILRRSIAHLGNVSNYVMVNFAILSEDLVLPD